MTNEIDWSQIHGVYGTLEEMPNLLKQVKAGSTEALGKILFQIEHQETIYPIAVDVVRLLLQMLGDDNKADKAAIFDYLHDLITIMDMNCLDLRSLRALYARTLIDLQLSFAIFGAVYLKLLTHPDVRIRQRASHYVVMFTEAPTAYDALLTAFKRESDPVARAMYVYFLGRYRKNRLRNTQPSDEFKFFEDLLLNDIALEVQIASALVHLEITKKAHDIGLKILVRFIMPEYTDASTDITYENYQAALAHQRTKKWQDPNYYPELHKLTGEVKKKQQQEKKKQANSFTNSLPDYLAEPFTHTEIFEYLLRFHTVRPLLLSSFDLTPLMAHLVCRCIIDSGFKRQSHFFVRGRLLEAEERHEVWSRYIPVELRDQKLPWEMDYVTDFHIDYTYLDVSQYHALKTVVECDKFWELPTNLFSFFYGLPDDREALRELVAKNKPAYLKE